MKTETKTWLKNELVSALGFTEVDEIVMYITNTFQSNKDVYNYLIELLGIPATRAEHISTQLFSLETSYNAQAITTAARGKEELLHRSTAINTRLKSSKQKNKKHVTTKLLNNALVINCLRCGRIEYNGGRRCAFCDTELHYEVDAVTADHAAQQHMEKLVRLDETGTERARVLDAEQYFYDEEQQAETRDSIDATSSSSSNARRPITIALDLDNKQFVDVKIARNEELAKDARELVDCIQQKMNKKGKRGNGSIHQPTQAPSVSDGDIREALVVVDDTYNLLFM